jgi:hypothetical protein
LQLNRRPSASGFSPPFGSLKASALRCRHKLVISLLLEDRDADCSKACRYSERLDAYPFGPALEPIRRRARGLDPPRALDSVKIFLHLIPEPEEKASELLRDLNANNIISYMLHPIISMIFVSMYVSFLLAMC